MVDPQPQGPQLRSWVKLAARSSPAFSMTTGSLTLVRADSRPNPRNRNES